MALRLASRKTKVLDLGEGGELTVKTEISKGDFNRLLRAMPADMSEDKGFTAVEADDFTVGLFSMLVEGWNATDADGNPVDSTVDNYIGLERESATVIDTALIEYFNTLTPTREEATKSKKASRAT